MTLSDPVANMLTIIRNVIMRKRDTATFPSSKIKLNICNKLQENKYLENYKLEGNNIIVKLGFSGKKCRIKQINKISTVSNHVHLKNKEIPSYCRVKGLYLISTSVGLLTQREAIKKKQGGKVLLFVS